MDLSQALETSEARAKLAIANASVGTWQWDLKTQKCEVNERWAQMLGYELADLLLDGEMLIDIEVWRTRVHPDDGSRLSTLLERYLAGLKPTYECKYRMRHQAGHWIWVHSHGQVVKWDAANQAKKIYGSHMDITAVREG